MIIKTTYILDTFYDTFECSTDVELLNYLKKYDFRRDARTGLPLDADKKYFRLGHRISFNIDGFMVQSNVLWGPRFYVGRSVSELPDGVFEIDMPEMATPYRAKQYDKFRQRFDSKDLKVFDNEKLVQVYPPHNGSVSEFERCINQVKQSVYKIEKVK